MDRTFLLAVKLYFCWLLILFLFVVTGGMLLGGLNDLSIHDLANWDGRHFLAVAQNGYVNQFQYAFFPLYPFSVSLVSRLTGGNYLYAGLLINFFSSLGVVFLFLKLLKIYREKNPVKTIIFFLFFPTSFYLICTYSESLFLLLVLTVFFFAEKKKFLPAAFFAALSSVTRITGTAVILGLLFYVFLPKSKLSDKLMVLLLSPAGLILYGIFLYFQTGNPLYFLVSELNWGRNITLPGLSIWENVQYIAYRGIRPESFTIFSDLLFTILGLGIGIRSMRFLKPPLAVYSVTSILLPLATALLLSVPRFLIVIFPFYILTARVNSRVFQISYIIISLVLLFLYFNFFLRNIWVS